LKADALRALLDAPATYFPELSSIAQKWLVSQAARDELLRMAESAKSVEPVRRALLAAGMAASAGQTREEIVVDGVESATRRRKKPAKPPAE
jgi:hypothetical protein